MSGERQDGRKAMDRMVKQGVDSGMPAEQATRIARNAARRAEDGRARDGYRDSKSTWFGRDKER